MLPTLLSQILALLKVHAERRYPGRWRWVSVLIELRDGPADVHTALAERIQVVNPPELDMILELVKVYAERRHAHRWRWASVLIDLDDGPTDVQTVLAGRKMAAAQSVSLFRRRSLSRPARFFSSFIAS